MCYIIIIILCCKLYNGYMYILDICTYVLAVFV